MREQAFALIIKRGKKECIDGWTDWRYDLLKCGICLCDEKECKENLKRFWIPVGNFTGGLLPGIYEKRRFDCKIPFT